MEHQFKIEGTLSEDIAHQHLIMFEKDGRTARVKIVDGDVDFTGNMPLTVAAKMLFEALIPHINEHWLELARRK